MSNSTFLPYSLPSFSGIILDVISVVLILFFSLIFAKVITIYTQRSLKEKMEKEHLNILNKTIYYGIITLAILLFIFPVLEIEASSLLVAGGVVGIVIGFASQSIVGNVISGIFLMIERPVKIGDQINIEGNFGFVEDINLVSTIMRTYDGLYIRVPNETVFTTNIVNFVANCARRFEYNVGIRYSDDADEAIDIIKELIDEHPFALKNPSPQVFVHELADNAVTILVRIWCPSTEWYSVKMKMLWNIKKTLEENEIEIAFPQRTVWFANELSLKTRDEDIK